MERGSRHRAGVASAISMSIPPRLSATETDGGNNSFGDEGYSAPRADIYGGPLASTRTPSVGSLSSTQSAIPQRFFHSRRVRKGEVDQPRNYQKDPKEKWVTLIPLIGLALGFGIAGFLVWDGLSSVVHHKYCQVLSDDFSEGLNTNIWTQEAEVGGFG